MNLFWERVEQTRKKLALSRAELARRAGISESTAAKGLKNRSKPSGAVRRQVEGVLIKEECAQVEQGGAA